MRIAYGVTGKGPPLVRAPHWLTHLEYDWHTPIWSHWLDELSRDHSLLRFDQRGCGLSDWDAADIVTCPALLLVSPFDEIRNAAPAVARDAFDRLRGPKEWIDLGGGHFGLLYHPSDEFDRASSAQVRFLTGCLGDLR